MCYQAEPYFTVQISCGFLAHTERMTDKTEAERIQQLCNLQTAVVKAIETKQKSEKPPKLYDLTTLQRDANRLFGYSATPLSRPWTMPNRCTRRSCFPIHARTVGISPVK